MQSVGAKARANLARGIAPLGRCTRQTARCADARDYHRELRPCCRGHIRQVVADTVAALEAEGVRYWADYGTILGAVRNPLTTWADYPWLPQEGRADQPLLPGIVPHDKDADFGFLGADWNKLMRVRAVLERQGYQLVVSPNGCKMKVRLSATNHSNLDLFGWHERPSGQLYRPRYIYVDNFKGREFKKTDLLPMTTVEWEGLTLPAPRDPVAFCAFRYGPKWRKPLAANHDGVRR